MVAKWISPRPSAEGHFGVGAPREDPTLALLAPSPAVGCRRLALPGAGRLGAHDRGHRQRGSGRQLGERRAGRPCGRDRDLDGPGEPGDGHRRTRWNAVDASRWRGRGRERARRRAPRRARDRSRDREGRRRRRRGRVPPGRGRRGRGDGRGATRSASAAPRHARLRPAGTEATAPSRPSGRAGAPPSSSTPSPAAIRSHSSSSSTPQAE